MDKSREIEKHIFQLEKEKSKIDLELSRIEDDYARLLLGFEKSNTNPRYENQFLELENRERELLDQLKAISGELREKKLAWSDLAIRLVKHPAQPHSPRASSQRPSSPRPASPRPTSPRLRPNEETSNLLETSLLLKRGKTEPLTPVKDGWGSYDLNREDFTVKPDTVGNGMFGKVVLGDCRGKPVAVKIFFAVKKKNLDKYVKECTLMRSLPHPNILLFMGACLSKETFYLVTEFCPRGSLYLYIHNNQTNDSSLSEFERKLQKEVSTKLDLSEKLRISKEIVEGLNWLHRLPVPIIHGDIKPKNILIMEDWSIKIADFGISILESEKTVESGTNLYMAPEVINNLSPTIKSDVYSYGILLCEILTEEFPYNGNIRDLSNRVCNGERPVLPRKGPASLCKLITDCWSQDPNKRPNFADIISSNIFDKSLIETISPPDCNSLWNEISQINGRIDKIPWKLFRDTVSSHMKISKDDEKILYSFFDIPKLNFVRWKKLESFIKMFGPLVPSGAGRNGTLDLMSKLWRAKWFWGEMDSDESSNYLKGKKAKAGTYLVRFSTRQYQYFISYIFSVNTKVEIKHVPITIKNRELIVEEIQKQIEGLKGLESPPPFRPARFNLNLVDPDKAIFYNDAISDSAKDEDIHIKMPWGANG